MDNPNSKIKFQPKIKIWPGIIIFAVLLSLISGVFLINHWWKAKQTTTKLQEREQTLAQLEQAEQQKAIQEYQTQQKDWKLTANLAKNPIIHSFLDDLLSGYACRFAEKENLTNYCLPLKFGGFYAEQNQEGTQRFRKLGQAAFDSTSKQTVISLNQIFLLNKLGYEFYLASPKSYLTIDFATLIETLAHELAHYFQFIKYEQSSCESSGAKDANGNFLDPELVKEHTQFTQEIKQMIVNSTEYPTLKKYWKAINVNS